MDTIKDIIREAWDSAFVRVCVFGLAIGAVPFYLLCHVKALLV